MMVLITLFIYSHVQIDQWVYMILYTEVLDLPDNLAKNFVTE